MVSEKIQISLRVPVDVLDRLNKEVKKQNVSRCFFVNKCISEGLEQLESGKSIRMVLVK